MRALRVETAVSEDGVIEIRDLPFRAGEKVEVIVLESGPQAASEDWRRLRGSVTRYDRPTEPAGLDDWDALK